jgi:uncharacterized protein (TIGR00730 family)
MKTPFIAPVDMRPEDVAEWQEERLRDTWRVFRIMSEFVKGFETLGRIGPSVSVFGSARTAPGTPYYELGVEVGRELARRGYGVITGAGGGIMEAANKGAREGGGVSVGLNIDLPREQSYNAYIDPEKLLSFEFFFARKTMFVKYAMGFIVLPGGFGTLDELFEALTLIQTRKSERFPVVLMGSAFWEGMLDWLSDSVLAEGNISPTDTGLFHVTDDPKEAVEIVHAFCVEHGHHINLEA